MDARPLNYASGRTQITREGDRLVVLFPPEESAASFWTRATVLFLLAACLLVFAFWPASSTRVVGMTINGPASFDARVVSLAFSAALAAMLNSVIRGRLVRTTLELRGKTLAYRRAGFWGVREDEYDLTRFADVDAIESSDGEWAYLWLRRAGEVGGEAPAYSPGDPLPIEIATRSASESEIADLEMVADALRQAVWPERAAARMRKSTFTRIGPDAIESDKGFAVRLPEPGVVEYRRGGKTMSLRVDRGWSADHAMCFVIGPDALSCWDGEPDAKVPLRAQREILHNLGEALREWGVRVLVGGTDTVPSSPSPGTPGEGRSEVSSTGAVMRGPTPPR